MNEKIKILILGSGFGGLYTALNLEKTLAKDSGVEITLINRENFFLFTPMLHEVAASDLDITHIVSPIRKLLKRVKVFGGDVEKIDLNKKIVHVSHGKTHHHHELSFDHLVLSLGSITNFYGNRGLEKNALTMKSLGDAINLRNHLIANLEEADFECCPKTREPLLNFVVAGGGFAGVETIAGINDFLREAVKFYPHLNEKMLRVTLVHAGDVILPELNTKLGKYAQNLLTKRGVEIHLNTRVTNLTDREVTLGNGTKIITDTLVWTAGTAPNPMLDNLPCAKERGKLLTDEFMRVESYENIWAVGDCAAIPDYENGGFHPPTAQHAIRQGKILAHNLVASVKGGQLKPFKFKTLGQLAALGRRTGVAQILGFNFSGFIAWWLWRTIYLAKLPRLEKKVRVALDWTLDLLFTKDLVQFLTLRAPVVSTAEEETITRPPKRAAAVR